MKADHERELVGAFFAPEVRLRYLSLLSTVKGQRTFVSRLAHLDQLDARSPTLSMRKCRLPMQ